jgi:molecular chaperone HscB
MQQMAWREALDAAADAPAVERLDAEVAAQQKRDLEALAVLLDEKNDTPAAAAQVRALMFVARFRQDIARRLDTLDPTR